MSKPEYAPMSDSVYDQFAELEERHFWFRGRRAIFRDLLDQALDGRRGLEIVEIGCGTGGMLPLLQEFGHVTALDVAHDATTLCHEKGFTRSVTGSGHALPFADGTFDLVALFDTIEHIPDDIGVLHETRRILKPGGLVFISVPAYQFLFSQNDRLVHHCRRYTRGQLRQRLRDTGFELARATYFNALLFPLILPAVLTVKLKEWLVGLPEEQTNLSHEFSRPVNEAFTLAMSSERHLLKNMSFPFGHSLIAIAKPA